MAHLDIGGNFISGNIDISVKSNGEESRCIHVSSIGHEDHQIPMIQNITSTKVPVAWKRKIKPKKTVLDECKDIIDVLSLIPPEYLQDEVEYDDENDVFIGPADNETMEVDNEEEGNIRHGAIAYGNGTQESITPANAKSMHATNGTNGNSTAGNGTIENVTPGNGTGGNGTPENGIADDRGRNVRPQNIS